MLDCFSVDADVPTCGFSVERTTTMSPEMTPSGNFRPARLEDATSIAAIVQEAYTPWVAVVGRRPRPMDDDYEARCAKGHAWLLEVNHQAVGAVIIEDMNGYLFLHNIAVSPATQHRGYGRSLMQFVEEEAKRRGYGEVKLTTSVVMQKNVDLYLKLGYAITSREPTATVDRLWMTKRLNTIDET
jgi:ribosomal protein S18 acetylase RimI-like enzyme